MTDPTTIDPEPMQAAYHAILEFGLIGMRNHSANRLYGWWEYLAAEIDHLHNIPSYMNEHNLLRHAYYYCTERPSYLEFMHSLLDHIANTENDLHIDGFEFVLKRHQENWLVIRESLLPYAEVINERQYMERLE